MKYFYLSFADDDGFRGGVAVELSDEEIAAAQPWLDLQFPNRMKDPESMAVGAAIAKTHDLDCNPGGQVATWALGDFKPPMELHKVYSKAELEALDKAMGL